MCSYFEELDLVHHPEHLLPSTWTMAMTYRRRSYRIGENGRILGLFLFLPRGAPRPALAPTTTTSPSKYGRREE